MSNWQNEREKKIISIEKEKSFNIIQHPLMIKILNEIGLKRIFLNMLKLIYENSTATLIIVKDESFLYDHEKEMATFLISILPCTGSTSQSN